MSNGITVEERIDSREYTIRDRMVYIYIVKGTIDSVAATEAVRNEAPDRVEGAYIPQPDDSAGIPRADVREILAMDSFRADPVFVDCENPAKSIWNVEVTYLPVPVEFDGDDEGEPPIDAYTFDTTGGTEHISTALETTSYPKADGEGKGGAPAVSNAINSPEDNVVHGIDITVPVFKFSITRKKQLNHADLRKISKVTGHINDAEFLGWPKGSVLFLGASGSPTNTTTGRLRPPLSSSDSSGSSGSAPGTFDVVYHFAGREPKTLTATEFPDVTFGTEGAIAEGWDYIWARYKSSGAHGEGEQLVSKKRIEAVYVQRVYRYANFSTLGV